MRRPSTHHRRPASLAVADHDRFGTPGVAPANLGDELPFGLTDVDQSLARYRVGEESHEVDGVTGTQRDADL